MFIIINIQRKGFWGLGLWGLSIDNLRSSFGIFSAFFHLQCMIFGVRPKSFQHYSIYPCRLQKIDWNLFRNFPYTFADIWRSPEIFSAFFHYPRSISEVRRNSFQKFFIFPCPTSKVRVLSRFYFGSELRINLDINTYSDKFLKNNLYLH